MTWFKNLTLYRVPNFPLDADGIAAALATFQHVPCTAFAERSAGFAHIRDERFVWSVEGEHFVAYRMSKKVLPAKVVNAEVERRAAELEKTQGFRPGRKQRRELKDQAYEDLLPRAFEVSRDIRVWISPKRGLIAIDTASQSVADAVLGGLLRAVQTPFVIQQAKYVAQPVAVMTQWISEYEAPSGFSIDPDQAVFAANEDAGASVKYSHITLKQEDAARLIEAGRNVVTLAMTFNDRVSFVLTGAGRIKRVTPTDVLKVPKKEAQDPTAHDADMLLMAGTYGELTAAVASLMDGYLPFDDIFAQPSNDGDNKGAAA
jgi:recombination associated protein RdgC